MKKWNRILSLLLACAMLAGWFPATTLHVHATEEEEVHIHEETAASAEEATVAEKSSAAASGTCGENLTWTLDEAGTLTISGTGEMFDWSYGGEVPWTSYAQYQILNITINEGVTSIGAYAFYGCDSLKAINIPESVTSIGKSAFYGCDLLTNVEIPEGVTSIQDETFCECTSLTSITIPESVTSIGNYVFQNCVSLTDIEIPDSVTNIGEWAFYNCRSIAAINIPEGVPSIGYITFKGCTSLTSITIPGSVTSIDSWAFENCSSLTEIIFQGNGPSIASSAFSNVVATAYYPADNPTWTEEVKQNYGGTLTWTPYSGAEVIASGTCGTNLTWTLDKAGTLTISGTGEMNNYSSNSIPWYSYIGNIEKIVIEDGVTTIGNSAFCGCSNLTSITIPDGVTTIGNYVFSGCSSLTSITIPEGVTTIGVSAFYNCSNLTSITIPESIISIGETAFPYCSSLNEIVFKGDAPSIGTRAFYGATATAYYPANNPTWTEEVKQDYGGNITWAAFDPCNGEHSYGTDGTCTACGAVESIPTVSSTDELVTKLRQAMVQRQTHIELRLNGVTLTSSDVSSLFLQARAHTGVPNEGDYIRANTIGYSTSLTTGSDASGVYSIVTVDCNFISTADMEAEVDAAVEELLNELNLWDASNYEKVKGAYDWISENVAYDYEWDDLEDDTNYYKHTTHAALIEKNAVCQGFASLYYRLMLELGVDCRYISGITTDIESSERHAWNIVYLDGKYYNCDPTWDRSLMGHYRYFLCTQANFSEHDRDSEFETAEFNAQYPMAVTPYVQNVTASGQINANLAWVLDGDTGTLTVAGTGAIPSYRFSYAPWYNYRESVRKIVVSEGITEVGERAFYWCTNCTEVQLPDSLIAIREYGFNNLRALRTITLPPNLTTIEFCGFSECVALTSITLPDSVTTVGPSAFSNCPSLISAVLSDGMTTVPNSMFFNDTNLQTVTLPSGVTYIGDTAFHSTGLRSVTIPATVTSMGDSVFASCGYLSAFTVEEGNPSYKTVGGVLFSADGTHLICYPAAKYGNYTVPEGTKYIDYGAFRSARYLYRVYFPSTLIEIGGYSFSYCTNLSSITLNSNITTVDDDAFRSCTSLSSVTFENPNVNLVGYTFANCTSLRSITLPANIQQIPNGLFYGCVNLQSITIPRTATKIGSSAFLDCDGLTSITVPGTVRSIGQQAFDFCNKLETITFENGVQSLGFICIRNAPKLKKVVIPRTVTTIEQPSNTDSYMFDGCPNAVLYVECGSYGYNYAVRRGLQYQMSHAYDLWYTVTEATCTEEGSERRDCENCDHYETRAVAAIGHNYSNEVTAPTCTEPGYTTHTCANCGDHYADSYVDAIGHYVLQAGTELVDPCRMENDPSYPFAMQNGWYTSTNHEHNSSSTFTIRALYDCEITLEYKTSSESGYDKLYVYVNDTQRDIISGESATRTLSAELNAGDEIQIQYSKDVSVNAGSDCGYFRITSCPQVEVEGDVPVSTDDLQPTCVDSVVCDGCGQTVKPAIGHYVLQAGMELVDPCRTENDPTYPFVMQNGWYTSTNHEHNSSSTFTIRALYDCELTLEYKTSSESGYDKLYVYVNDTQRDMISGESGTRALSAELNAGDEIQIQYSKDVSVNAGSDCGYFRITSCPQVEVEGDVPVSTDNLQATCVDSVVCDGCGQTVKPATGHNYSNVVTAPTCTAQGYTTYTCANCADSYVDSYVNALDHDWDEGIVTIEPTEETEGQRKFTCQRCGETRTEVIPVLNHVHSYTATVTPPTCTEQGYTTHTCRCGDSYVDTYVPATGHTYGSWTVTQAPTCLETGSERRDCRNCDHYETREIAATGHNYTSVVTAPTCTDRGYTTHTCQNCGNRYADTYVAATGHTYGNWTVTQVPTCLEKGTEQRVCRNCDFSETREVAATGHSYTAVVTAPTCTDRGYTTHTCQNCGNRYVDTYVAATGHTYGNWTVTQAPTCLEKGTEQRVCRNCDFSETREVAATGHSYTAVVTAPTCTDRGYTTHTCQNCDNSYVDSYVNALGHDWNEGIVTVEPTEETEGQRKFTCQRCGETRTEVIPVLNHVHSYTAVVTPPTCTEQGYTTHTCRCGDSYVDSYVNATGHTYGNWTVTQAPTCLETGNERRDCRNCDHYETREIAAIGHNYTSVVTAPTCTDRGYTTHTCSRCQNSYQDSYVAALGHSFVNYVSDANATCTTDGTKTAKCERCEETDTLTDLGSATGHTFGSWVAVTVPTCLEKGTEKRTCRNCDFSETREVAALGHTYQEVITAPTCTDRGYTTHTCSRCQNSYQDSFVNALGHLGGTATCKDRAVCTRCGTAYGALNPENHAGGSEIRNAREATCVAAGYTGDIHCEGCGIKLRTGETIPAKGHSYSAWTQTQAATCLEKGTERRECQDCDHYEIRDIPALGHDYRASVTAPTCIESGYTTHICSHCQDSYVDTYVAATGHSFGSWAVTETPTCTRPGNEQRNCQACQFREIREVSPLGHDCHLTVTEPTCTEQGYNTYTCIVCGHIYVTDYVPALDHDWDAGMITLQPTEQTEGQRKYTCQRCGQTKTESIPTLDHVHSYTAVVTPPTCTEQGYTTHTCRCGNSYVDTYVPATGHTYGSWTVTQAPSCLETGSERRDCRNCDHFETREIVATGHNYTSVVTAPTCTDRGYTTHTCQNCGNRYVDSYVNATGHTYGNWTVTQAPTCLETGSERRECRNCDHFETREIAATGHHYTAVVTAPTCTDRGYTTHTCANCGDSYVDTYVNATGHSFGAWTVTQAPTCLETGSERRECRNCDHFETREIAATGHSYNNVVTAPTCTDRGYTTHTCQNCGNRYVDSYVNATGHTYGNWTVTQAPTCLETGNERRDCRNCDYYETRDVAATGHNYTSVVIAPTCTDRGYTTHTCQNCGNHFVDTYTEKLGHDYGAWYETKPATLEEEGEERRDCSRCDDFQTRKIPMLTHNYTSVVTPPTCTEPGYTTHTCTNCGDSYVDTLVDALGHNFRNYTSDNNATCTTDGTKTAKCERCDVTDTVVDVGSATGHSFGPWTVITAPTCTTKGTEQRECQNCDHVETREVPITDHNYSEVITSPTCTAQGYTTHTCQNCGNHFEDTYVNALGHAYGEWYETKPATTEEEGEERRDCSRCDDFQTRKIPMLTHNYTSVVTPPTCTAQGYTTHTCSNCGDSYVDTYVNATGHTYGNWQITQAPTCTAKGMEQRECQNCDHVETREVPVTDHSYNNVVTAPTCTAQGYTTHTCVNCSNSYVDSYVDAIGHDYESVVTPPTTESQGFTTHTCQNCGDSYTDSYVDALTASVIIGDQTYGTITEALEAAEAGDVVQLASDVDASGETLILRPGVTLHLGAYDLIADGFIGFNGSILDATRYSATGDYGKLIVPKENLVLSGGQAAVNGEYDVIPVWNGEDAYILANALVNDTEEEYGLKIDEENKTIRFSFVHKVGGSANNAFFKDGTGDNALKIIIRLEWASGNGVAYQDFVYNDDFVGLVSGGGYNYSFVLNNYDILNIDLSNLKVTAMILTDAGTITAGQVWTQANAIE